MKSLVTSGALETIKLGLFSSLQNVEISLICLIAELVHAKPHHIRMQHFSLME